jgi:hypothetical protein
MEGTPFNVFQLRAIWECNRSEVLQHKQIKSSVIVMDDLYGILFGHDNSFK